VDEAATGRAGLERLQSGSYDLVTLDLKLPDVDGRVLWHWLRSHNPELATRVIFMTGDIMSAETQSFLEEAGCPVLKKPLAVDQVSRMVASFLARG
jgi:two-component system NtrC family sensor kinase